MWFYDSMIGIFYVHMYPHKFLTATQTDRNNIRLVMSELWWHSFILVHSFTSKYWNYFNAVCLFNELEFMFFCIIWSYFSWKKKCWTGPMAERVKSISLYCVLFNRKKAPVVLQWTMHFAWLLNPMDNKITGYWISSEGLHCLIKSQDSL